MTPVYFLNSIERAEVAPSLCKVALFGADGAASGFDWERSGGFAALRNLASSPQARSAAMRTAASPAASARKPEIGRHVDETSSVILADLIERRVVDERNRKLAVGRRPRRWRLGQSSTLRPKPAPAPIPRTCRFLKTRSSACPRSRSYSAAIACGRGVERVPAGSATSSPSPATISSPWPRSRLMPAVRSHQHSLRPQGCNTLAR